MKADSVILGNLFFAVKLWISKMMDFQHRESWDIVIVCIMLNVYSDASHLPQTPSVAENGNLDVDESPGPPLPSVSSDSSEPGVRAERFAPGPTHCRGWQGQRRQNQVRGQRRGGRSRPQHRRAAPITEHLDKLSLSSDGTEGPIKAKAQGNHGHQMQVNAEVCESKTGRDVCAEQQDSVASPDDQPVCQAASETECPEDAPDSAGGRVHRGRRRGPHRPVHHTGAPGPAHYHWDGRGSRSRGGPNNLYSRGGGPRRGHGRGFQHKVVERERGREEVLWQRATGGPMNKCMCASIIELHRLKPCTRNDLHCSILYSSTSPCSWSLVCTFMHTKIRYRWLLLCVVVQYDFKELQIKNSLDVSVSVFPVSL